MSAPLHVVVVGGGVMGCTLTYILARRGVRVTLLERAPAGTAGASAVPVALLNPHRGRSGRASPFDLRALHETWALSAEVAAAGGRPGAVRSGVLRLASNPKQARRWERLSGVAWFGPEAVPEPVVRSGFNTPFGGFIVPAGGWLEPARWLSALRALARAYGAEVIAGCEVLRVARNPGAAEPATPEGAPGEYVPGYVLETARGGLDALRAEAVVLCVGARALPALPEAALPPALTHVAGEVVGFDLPAAPAYPLAGAVYGAAAGGRFYLGGNHRPEHHADPSAPEQLRRAGSWFLPPLATAPQTSVWSGVRAKREDNAPLTLELAPNLWFAGALAGRGFLAAATVAKMLATTLTETLTETLRPLRSQHPGAASEDRLKSSP